VVVLRTAEEGFRFDYGKYGSFAVFPAVVCDSAIAENRGFYRTVRKVHGVNVLQRSKSTLGDLLQRSSIRGTADSRRTEIC